MGKDQIPPVSEQCTEEETTFGQQVVPKNSNTTIDNVVSATTSLSLALSKNLALPFTKPTAIQQGYPLYDTKVPNELPIAKGMMAFSDSNVAYASAVSLLNRPAFFRFKCDLPNESIESQKKNLNVVVQDFNEMIVNSIFELFAAGGDQCIRKCPGGRGTNSSTGNGATSGGGGYTSSAPQWVTGCIGGGSGGNYLPSGSGDGDDDDPFHNNRPIELPRSHYLEPGFQSEDHLDKLTEEILNDDMFRDLIQDLSESVGPSELQILPDIHSSRGPYYDNSEPAPMTPGGPMTPASMPISSPAPTSAPVSEVQRLFELHNLLKQPSASVQQQQQHRMSIPQQPTSPGYPNYMVTSHNDISSAANFVVPAQCQQQQQPSSPSDFFVMTNCFNGQDRCIRMAIKNQGDNQAYQALGFCHDLFSKYGFVLQQDCTLPIATQGKAKLCSMKVDVTGLTFSMPVNCLPLNEWIVKNDDLRSRHLVIQQVLNTLVVLFQGENDLSFWGSFEVFVAPNLQVYLHIDFNKSLAIQKIYAESGQSNCRVEDRRVLKELFELLLKPYLTNSLVHVSPQLESILTTFQQVLNSQGMSCVQQVAMMARVMGERRICCMQAHVHGYLFVYTLYSVEHEPVSQSLGKLKPLVMNVVQRPCVVLHENFTPVSSTEISARHGSRNHVYILMSQDFAGQDRIPGALYID